MRARWVHVGVSGIAGLWLLSLGTPRALAVQPAPVAPASATAPSAGWPPAAPPSFADLAARLLPAVVNIASTETVKAPQAEPHGAPPPKLPPKSPFDKFFHDFMDHGQGQEQAPPERLESLGSGFIIDPAGFIVTNNHVIAGAATITVTLQDGTVLPATVVGHDKRMDLALLRVHARAPLPSIAFGDSEAMRVGDWVLAIGNPFGLGGTVTSGIISARGRNLHEGPYDDFIQTDAPINRGNSGGPLFDMRGDVIGINTAIFSPSGGSIGIGFAIPSNVAAPLIAQLRKYGHARRGWLGVRVQEVTPDIAASLGLSKPEGALVAGVMKGSPAEAAGMKTGDVILSFANHEVKAMHELPLIVAETSVGSTVPVIVWRDGKKTTLSAKIALLEPTSTKTAAGEPVKHDTDIASLGLTLAPLSPELREKYHLGPNQKGVVVTQVARGGPAAAHGVKPGDVVLEVQQQEIATPAEVEQQLDVVRREGRPSVLVLVQRGDAMNWIPLPLGSSSSKGKPG